jgi:3-oxoacyl-[acyl-carrier protein] reductase
VLLTSNHAENLEVLMNGKIIVITGASGALGQVVVETAIARGAVVAAIDHSAKTPASTPQLLQIGGVDLSDAAQASRAIAAAVAQFGKIDVLINIAGAFAFEMVGGGSPDSWEKMHRLNLLTALNTSRAAIPYLVASNAGRIVNIGAIGALQAGAGMGPYAASKAGVHRLTEALAAELKGKVTVNAVLPSTIDTPANRRDMPDADFAKWVTAQELAEVILFLASDAASAITGALLPVSGRV